MWSSGRTMGCVPGLLRQALASCGPFLRRMARPPLATLLRCAPGPNEFILADACGANCASLHWFRDDGFHVAEGDSYGVAATYAHVKATGF